MLSLVSGFLGLDRKYHSLLVLLLFDRGLVLLLLIMVVLTFSHKESASLRAHTPLSSFDLPSWCRLSQRLLKALTHLWRLNAVVGVA